MNESTAIATSSSGVRYEFLDALRGFAILGVIALHSASMTGQSFAGIPYAQAGASGVQLFFVISAFTIFLTLDRAKSREKHVFRNFFIRRFFRILPMFWVAALFYSFAPGREVYEEPFAPGFVSYALTLVLQHGWDPYSINSVVPGGWSIAVEATFYLMAPVLFLLLRDWQRALLFFFAAAILCVTLNLALTYGVAHQLVFVTVHPQLVHFFQQRWFPSQLPVFACGVLAYRLWQKLPPGFGTRRNGLILLAAAAFVINASVASGGLALLPEQVCFSLGFLLLMLALAAYACPPLVNTATCLLGRVSYSFYLMHFVMLSLARYFIAVLHVPAGGPTFAAYLVFTVTLTLPVAFLAARFVEKPFIKLGSDLIRRFERPPLSAPVGAVAD